MIRETGQLTFYVRIRIVDKEIQRGRARKDTPRDIDIRGTRHNAGIIQISSVSLFVVYCIAAAKMK